MGKISLSEARKATKTKKPLPFGLGTGKYKDTQVVNWLETLSDAGMKFIGTYVPGLDDLYESVKRVRAGGPGNYRKASDALYKELQNAYSKLYGSKPSLPSDLKVLTSQRAKEKYLEMKGRARGSDLEQAVRKASAKATREANKHSDEYSQAMTQYEKDLGKFENRLTALQQAELKAREAIENPQWQGSSPTDIIKNYEKGMY